jgi:hypothetical protein
MHPIARRVRQRLLVFVHPSPIAHVDVAAADGEPAEISALDGIDILTSIREAGFEFHYRRGSTKVLDGLNIVFLAADDIDAISPQA